MTRNEFTRKFPNASESTIKANCPGSETSSTEPQQIVCNESVGEEKRKTSNPTRILVSIRSFRTRLLDPDNAVPKFFIDCLRYAKIIEDDTSKHIKLDYEQFKVKKRTEERTEIEVLF